LFYFLSVHLELFRSHTVGIVDEDGYNNNGLRPFHLIFRFNIHISNGGTSLRLIFCLLVKGTVQRELRWVKIGINRTARINCMAGKCNFPCPKGHHHESIINVIGGCSTF
jgi:hypothetical protein